MSLNKRILIADDERDLREYLAKLLLGANRKNEISFLVEKMRGRLRGRAIVNNSEQDSSEIRDEPYEIYTAGNGADAIQMTRDAVDSAKPFAVIFLDIRMPPGPDGLETAKKINEIDPNAEIVVMTAYADHDHKTISEAVPRPEKLLYIKKPFHPDEISQAAFCLTAKWNAEAVERKRKSWLELIVKNISKLKTHPPQGQNVYMALLKAVQAFTDSESAFVTVWDGSRWNIKQSIGISDDEAAHFATENSRALLECRATQSIGNKYVLPIKRENFSAAAVLSGITPQNDPEWYNLLMLLEMTAGETLASLIPEQKTIDAKAAIDKIRNCADLIKKSLKDKPEAAMAEDIINAAEIVAKALSPKDA